MKTQYALFAALAVTVGACGIEGTPAQASEPIAAQRTLSVSGTGKATGTPDMAMMDFAVIAQADTASAAMQQNAARMTKVRDALKGLGVQSKDLQTSGFYLQPRYARDERGRTDTNKIVGYTAGNTLAVRLRDVDKVGTAIDRAVGAGANNLGSLQFGFQNPDDMLEKARRAAVKDARALADLLVEEAGATLGPVQSISVNSYQPRPQARMRMEAMAMDAAPAATPIEAGEGQLSVTVHMVYELK